MGLIDQVIGKVGGALSGKTSESSPLLSGLLEMLGTGGSGGGLAGLVKTFQAKGLGDIVNSWVGTGSNLPISPTQIQDALSGASLNQLAEKAGLSPQDASAKLAEMLPKAVDTLTPQGRLPEGGALEQALSLLKGRLG